jgi:hypothetical protein
MAQWRQQLHDPMPTAVPRQPLRESRGLGQRTRRIIEVPALLLALWCLRLEVCFNRLGDSIAKVALLAATVLTFAIVVGLIR